jgi:hypothetical protein
MLGQGKVLEGRLTLTRTFKLADKGVALETLLESTGQDVVTELYETIPIYTPESPKDKTATIEFQVNGKWQPATTEAMKSTAVRVGRNQGHILITFEQPRHVKLSPEVWADTYLSKAKCRNVMIDLLDGQAAPVVLRGERRAAYQITAGQ